MSALSLSASFSIGLTSLSYLASSSLYLSMNAFGSAMPSFSLAFLMTTAWSFSTKSAFALTRLASGLLPPDPAGMRQPLHGIDQAVSVVGTRYVNKGCPKNRGDQSPVELEP